MRILLCIPLLALFVVPWELRVSDDLASHSLPSLSTQAIQAVPDSAPLRVSSSTPPHAAVARGRATAQVAAVLPAISASTSSPTSPATSTPTNAPDPVEDFAAQMEAEILRLSNGERVTQALPALTHNAKLRDIAWLHSADMRANNYFSHDDPSGCSSPCRATNAGYHWRAIGENIYMMSGYKLSAQKSALMVVEGWMNSPGHRANILGDSFTESGIGVISDGKSIYVTVLYAKPR